VRLLYAAILLILTASCTQIKVNHMEFDKGSKFYYSENEYINYERRGQGEIKVIFLHGFGASLQIWTDIIKFFPQDKFTIYLLDLKGSGFSSKPRHSDYSMSANAQILSSFLADARIGEYILIGHSFGGGVALNTGIINIDNHMQLPRAMVLIDSAAYKTELPTFVKNLRIPLFSNLMLNLTSSDYQARYTLENIYYDKSKVTGDKVARYSFFLGQHGHNYALVQTAKQILPVNYEELTRRYSELKMPVLVIWGKQDPALPLETGQRLSLDLPNAQLKVIDKCGHNPHEEWPEQTAELILQFISNLRE